MKCQFIKQNKEQCRANAISNDTLCFTHNPKTKEAKRKAVIRGGKAPKPRFNEELLPFMPLDTRDDYLQLLEQTIDQLHTPPTTYQKALAIGSLMSVATKIQNIKIEQQDEEGLFDFLRKGLLPDRNEIPTSETEKAHLSKQDYTKILEVVINKLRTVVITPQKAQAIARLSSLALEMLIIPKSKPMGLADVILREVEEKRQEKQLTALPVQ